MLVLTAVISRQVARGAAKALKIETVAQNEATLMTARAEAEAAEIRAQGIG